MTRRRVLVLLATLVVAAAALWWWLRPAEVGVLPVTHGTAVEATWASGTVTPVDAADVRALVSGPIGALYVQEGDFVAPGQVVAELYRPELGHEVAARQAELEAAEERLRSSPQGERLEAVRQALATRLAQARRDARRLAALVSDGAASPQDAERARVEVRSLQAELEANVAERRDLTIALETEAQRTRAGTLATAARADDRFVRAPIGGQVLTLAVEAGEVVGAQQALMRVGSTERMRVVAEVDEADVPRVHLGTRALVRLYAFEDQVLEGTVVHIDPAADARRRTFGVDVDLRAPPFGVRPGMTCEVNLILAERPGALLAPAAAIRGDVDRDGDETAWVWVVDGGRLARREVTLGLRDLDWVEVRRGLALGERVAVTVPEDAAEGDRVEGVPAPTPPRPLSSTPGAPGATDPMTDRPEAAP